MPVTIEDVIDQVGSAFWAARSAAGIEFTPSQGGAAPPEATAWVPPLAPESLGNPGFRAAHGVRYAYVSGEMAHGIAGERVVVAMARAGLLGLFGAAGLPLPRVERAIDQVRAELGEDAPYGFGLVHQLRDPAWEMAIVELYLRSRIRCLSASAFTTVTPAIVRFRATGLAERPDGSVSIPNRVMVKLSRGAVAEKFLAPAPERILDELTRRAWLTAREAELARRIPVADDIVCEGDSGGHTDKQPLAAILTAVRSERSRASEACPAAASVRLGCAGGLGTPTSIAAAFVLGADFVVTGSINQSCVEADTSLLVKQMLARARDGDFASCPSADMFELGAQVQVLKQGTLFAARSRRLYDIYRANTGVAALSAEDRRFLEEQCFQQPIAQVWEQTRAFFQEREPQELAAAERDERHRLALVLRWYLGWSSRWAREGHEPRRADFQIWCGPAMAAFNQWAKGSFLEDLGERRVAAVAEQLMTGAARVLRRHWLALSGLHPCDEAESKPRREQRPNPNRIRNSTSTDTEAAITSNEC